MTEIEKSPFFVTSQVKFQMIGLVFYLRVDPWGPYHVLERAFFRFFLLNMPKWSRKHFW